MSQTPEQTPDRTPPERSGWLRLLPPVAALGTAFVLQVIAVADLLGEVLAERQTGPLWVWYGTAGLLGLAFASCLEGGAAYLMDLYDKHLLARDSVWVLRTGMGLYVAGSAALIHWWLTSRGLPELIAWALAGMSASALFLWSRGSRWRNRQAMRAAGQIDPALPRLPMAAKLLHPVRSLVTVWLISWGPPVRTVDGARRRYEAWRRLRRTRKSGPSQTPVSEPSQTPVSDPAVDPVGQTPADPPQTRRRRQVRTRAPQRVRTLRSADDDDMLARLRSVFPDRLPSINEVQQTVGGGRSRAIRLRGLLNGNGEGSDDESEREAVQAV